MQLFYAGCRLLAGSGMVLLGVATASAQQVPEAAAHLPSWIYKGGLRLTHLSYSRNATAWRALVPASLGLEYRLGSRGSLYSQLDTDVQLQRAAAASGRGRAVAVNMALPAAALGVGSRWYYSRPAAKQASRRADAPEFGRYLALEAGGELTHRETLTGRVRTTAARRASWTSTAVLSPYLFARWGVQNRLRPHVLYDLNAGLGLVAPPRAAAEHASTTRQLDVAVQANASLYWAR